MRRTRGSFDRSWTAVGLGLPTALRRALRTLRRLLPEGVADRARVEEALRSLLPGTEWPRELDPLAPEHVPLPPIDAGADPRPPTELVLGRYRRMSSPGEITLYWLPILLVAIRLWLAECAGLRIRGRDEYDLDDLDTVTLELARFVYVHELFHHVVDWLRVVSGVSGFHDVAIEEPLAQGFVQHGRGVLGAGGYHNRYEWWRDRSHVDVDRLRLRFFAMAPPPYRHVLGLRSWPGLAEPADLANDVEAWAAVALAWLQQHGALPPTMQVDAAAVLLLDWRTAYVEVVWEER